MASSIVEIVRSVIGDARPKTIHDPYIDMGDIARVEECLHSNPVGYDWIERFEAAVADRCRRKYALAVSSGTAALHLAMLAVGVKTGSMVAMPTLNFVAAAAMARQCGAVILFHANQEMPVGEGLAARLQVHLLGHPVEPSRFEKMFDVPVIEDAAEALGSMVDGEPCGCFGDVSILSFNNNKIVTTGSGGMLLTNDEAIYKKAKHLATTARVGDEYWHDQVGFNYRMANHAAALGVGQVDRLSTILYFKINLAERYREALEGSRFTYYDRLTNSRPNCWINAAFCTSAHEAKAALMDLRAAGIPARPMFVPLHLLPPYQRYARAGDADLATMADTAARMICLPSGSGL